MMTLSLSISNCRIFFCISPIASGLRACYSRLYEREHTTRERSLREGVQRSEDIEE
jgi:hypothetical protein